MIMLVLRKIILVLIAIHLASCAGRLPDSSEISDDKITDNQPQSEIKKPIPPQWSDDALSSFKQGVSLVKSNPDKAVLAFQKAIQYEPKMEAAYYNLGLVYYSSIKDQKKQQQQLQQLMKNAENQGVISARLINLIAVNLRQQGKFLEAEANYQMALTMAPNHLSSLANMAILQDLYLGQLSKAQEYYKRYQVQLEQQEKEDYRINNWLADLQQRIKTQNKENKS